MDSFLGSRLFVDVGELSGSLSKLGLRLTLGIPGPVRHAAIPAYGLPHVGHDVGQMWSTSRPIYTHICLVYVFVYCYSLVYVC